MASAMEDTGSTYSDCSYNSQVSSGDLVTERDVDGEAVRRLSEEKKKKIMKEEPIWRESIRKQMEEELDRRVREALETPPLERIQRRKEEAQRRQNNEVQRLNSHILLDLSSKNSDYFKCRKWQTLQAKQQMQSSCNMTYIPPGNGRLEFIFRDELSKSNQDEFPGVFGLDNFSEGIRNIREDYTNSVDRFPPLKAKIRHFYTKQGFLQAVQTGKLPDGFSFLDEFGTYRDKYGVIRNEDGPFWPTDCAPMYATPRFLRWDAVGDEPLYYQLPVTTRTIDNQETQFTGRWRGVLIVYDSERSPREHRPQPVPEGCCPNLVFESRFESGNLRQARRVGHFEYELVLKTDLYTNRHTQWYYFRVKNAVSGVTYKFRIVNLLKRDSLYNYGMRPLAYSEINAQEKQIGWIRTGYHISYSRNVMHLHCPLLQRGVCYYNLEWQMEFPNDEDTCYLAHCYPYTFTDLKEDLDTLLQCPYRQQYINREVLCETRAGNSCFLLTVTNFENLSSQVRKKAVVVTARVHPGESQASWMMKGLLDFLTSTETEAVELRNKFIFKIVPMLNPDGVIVGNYRCSLAARDLNRNYRHPRRESFPTVWYVKNMIEVLIQKHQVLLYCDLHGHSRKHNVFMYGNNTSYDEDVYGIDAARAFIGERLFPWLMSQKAPEKFSFPSCKFHIRRCKESTGRVVMWRQMRILNSFTLEATFSGTVLDQSSCRHFNIADFLGMGKTLGQVVLDYEELQTNKARQTEVVLELTRVITQQILQSRGLLPPNIKLPDFNELANLDQESDMTEEQAETIQGDAEKWTEAIMNLVTKDKEDAVLEEKTKIKKEEKREEKKEEKKKHTEKEVEKGLALTRTEIDQLIDTVSLKTMDGCLNILAELNVRDAIEISDSSDSDSESEPEMKSESKSRKKKRKSRKQRDKDHHDKKSVSSAEKKPEERPKALSALPALVCGESPSTQLLPSANSESFPNNQIYKNKANAALDKYMRLSKHPHFVSKYEGRRNGGVPCFTEERSMERQAKRIAEMKKKSEEDRQRDLTFYVALNEGTANISQALVGFNIRTGYTHADNFKDLSPAIHNSNGFVLPTPVSSTITPVKGEGSMSDGSDIEGEMPPPGSVLPVPHRRNPYQFDHMAQSLSGSGPSHSFRKPIRTGPVLKSVTRHLIKSSTPPLIASGIMPSSRSPVSDHVTNQRLDERARVSRSSGPLLKALHHYGIGQGFSWE